MTAVDCIWSYPPASLVLSGDDIHVWFVSLDHVGSSFDRLAQVLSVDERTRAQRFHFERDRRRFVVRRGLLRTILGCYVGVEADRLQFCYGYYGKPALAETSGGGTLRFNLSHSQGLALYAVTRHREIGVDLECIRPILEAEQIAERYFSARENAVFRALPAHEKLWAFFNCWTRKEAYLKALGDGLARPLDEFDVSLAPGELARLLYIRGDPEEVCRWSLQDLTPGPGYVAALGVEGHDWRLQCWQWFE